MNKLHGVLVPSITPFKKNSEIDYEAIKSHVDFLISNGVHGIIPAGSTGEHAMLTLEEKKCILGIGFSTLENVSLRTIWSQPKDLIKGEYEFTLIEDKILY